jgi:hypothetical protein
MEVPHSGLRCAWPCTESWPSYMSAALPCKWTLALLHANQLPDAVMKTGSLACQSAAWHRIVCQSAAWHRTKRWLFCMSVSCLTPYWTLALLHARQLPDTTLNTGSLACQSAAGHRVEHWVPCMPVSARHRTEHWLSCMSVSCLTPYWTLSFLYVSQLSDPVNEPWLPSISDSCLILWMNPGSLAYQTVAWSCEWTLALLHITQLPDPVNEPWFSCLSDSCLILWMNPGSLAYQTVAWSCEWTLAPLHVSQLPDPVNEPWLPCISDSCLTLWMNPGSLAYQSLYQSDNTRRDADKHNATCEQRKRKTKNDSIEKYFSQLVNDNDIHGRICCVNNHVQ